MKYDYFINIKLKLTVVHMDCVGLLESALSQPASEFGGQRLHETVFEMAAAYLFHLVQNHPFQDGNKRIGAACAHAFLYLNGFMLSSECEDAFTESCS